jgi:hypothetical protein
MSAATPSASYWQESLDRLLDCGEIAPSMLRVDQTLVEKMKQHPLLEWKASNVCGHAGR